MNECVYDLEHLLEREHQTNLNLLRLIEIYEERINKAIEYIKRTDIEVLKYHDIPSETTSYEIVTVDLLKILRGDSDK